MRIATYYTLFAGVLLVLALLAPPAQAQYFRGALSGASEVPPNGSTGVGNAIVYLNGSQITLSGSFVGLGSNYLASHIHQAAAGVNGPVVFTLAPTVDGDQRGAVWPASANSFAATGDQVTALTSGNFYVNVHSSTLGGGEIRGQLLPTVVINEARIDQSGTDNDEYFELAGAPGTSLNDLTYLVIGDDANGAGAIEEVTSLAGQTIPGDGFFLAAEATLTLGGAVPDLVTSLNFENSAAAPSADNVTHLLVTGFSGTDGQDLDTNDDGVLDATPWTGVLDAFSLIDPVSTEPLYARAVGGLVVGPDGTFRAGHIFRDGATAEWRVGAFDPASGSDTPGIANTIVVANEPGSAQRTLALTVDANPAHHHVGIRYTLTEEANVRLALYDVTGREIAVVQEGSRPAGQGSAVLDATTLAPGVYVLRLTAGGASIAETITIAR
jgi:hypothetical protein